MHAVDTNILIRYLMKDDPQQAVRVREIMDGPVFVGLTVLAETQWVLRSVFRLPADRVIAALRALMGLDTVTVGGPELVAKALDWAQAGMEFTDALNLAIGTDECASFLTFDVKLVKVAARLGVGGVRVP